MDALAEAGYRVLAFDLLGQGRSEKPSDVHYSIALWSRQLSAFLAEFCDEPAIVCGNSLGSLVALSTAAGEEAYNLADSGINVPPSDQKNEDQDALSLNGVRGICLFNCAVGLNLRGVAADPTNPPVVAALLGLFSKVILGIFGSPLLDIALRYFVTKDALRGALESLYLHAPENVDDELVDSFFYPAKSEGALGALRQIYVNDPGPSPMALHGACSDLGTRVPIHGIWGDNDAVTPLSGGVGSFYSGLAADAKCPLVTLDVIPAGHIPMDDNPEASNAALLAWLRRIGV